MYLIGIDISKFKHNCFIQTETGEVIKKSFSFNNSKDGFDYLLIQLKSILNIYETINDEVSNLESNIESIMKEYHTNITSIPGIFTISAAQIIGEFGDFNKFSSASKLLAYARLEPSTIQSSTMIQNGKMVKHGSSHLRYILMNVAITTITHNPTFYEYYSRNIIKKVKTIELPCLM